MSSSPQVIDPVCAVAGLGAAVDDVAAAAWWRLGEDDLVTVVGDVEVAQRRLDAAKLALVREVESRGVAASRAMTDTASWLAHRLQLRPAEAAALVRTAATLGRGLEPTAAALRDGAINLAQAHVVTTALGRLHDDVTDADRANAETFLLEQATLMDATALAKVGRHLVATLNPTAAVDADHEQACQHTRRRFSLIEDSDGSWWVSGQLHGEGGRALNAALDPLAAPRPSSTEGADPRTPGQRRADALVDLAERALAVPEGEGGALPSQGGARPTVVVTINHDVLTRRLAGAGITDTDTAVPPQTVRRLACDARLVPAVLDGDSRVLDLGRSVYAVPPHLRRALILRDGGCAVPGCGRPATWCHGHHIWHWADGGPTSLDNLVLVCGHHHRRIHDECLSVRMVNGQPAFTLPDGTPLTDRPLPHWRQRLRDFRARPHDHPSG